MTEPTLSKDEVLEVLQHFDFFGGQLDELSIVPRRLTNQNARFRIEDREWVIKRYNANNPPKNLLLSHELQKCMIQHGLPVARLELTRSGESFVTLHQYIYTIHQWIRGVHHNPIESGHAISAKLVNEIAVNLGRFHSLVSTHCEHRVEPELESAKSLLRTLRDNANDMHARSRLGVRRDTLWKWKPFKSRLDCWILESLPKFQTMAERLSTLSLESMPSLQDVILAHNDINWLNLIFDQDENLIAIIDFDNIQFAPRQFEIGSAALVVSGGNGDFLNLFLKTYQEASGLSVDPDAVRISMLIRCARSYLWSVQAYRNNAIHDVSMLEAWMRFLDNSLDLFVSDPKFGHLVSD